MAEEPLSPRKLTPADGRSLAEIAAEIALLHARIEAGVDELRHRARSLPAQANLGRLARAAGTLARLLRLRRAASAPRTAGGPRGTPGL
ncbi:MAG: hypothetical protein QN183_08790 [Armatimonadota bacterium]|nr:hypothetical protein [Armatimonadota bacterium]MDR7533979.1 hypothetical protein [Armatimonadota bacterium]MDR7536447.1 hypothetical protein [Armatimonadota bacterium]